jgi:hypothetical protein
MWWLKNKTGCTKSNENTTKIIVLKPAAATLFETKLGGRDELANQ